MQIKIAEKIESCLPKQAKGSISTRNKWRASCNKTLVHCISDTGKKGGYVNCAHIELSYRFVHPIPSRLDVASSRVWGEAIFVLFYGSSDSEMDIRKNKLSRT
jgi:hypothetical protein